LEYREKTELSRGKIGLFRELEEQPGPLGPLQSRFHRKEFDQPVDQDHAVPLDEDMREDGGNP